MARLAGRRLVISTTRLRIARAGVAVVLLVVAALLWLLILALWADGAGRAIPPVGVVEQAADWIR
jgi:hypothetical protein